MAFETARPDKITLENISKLYGSVSAVADIALSVRPGEFLTLLGPSGSGKSTLLNIISGATDPSAGRILMDGEDITARPARERGLGMVFQNYALMPHMSVFENVAFPLKVRGVPRAEIEKRVHEVLGRVGLYGLAHRKPRQLSGGQQQRVGIARCIVYSPGIILMDEPLGALDKKLREQMQDEIKRLHRELGTTMLYVTHDQEEALNLSDTICLMNGGNIEQLGTPEDLYFEPRTAFAAEFLGESNLFSGILVDERTARTESGLPIRVSESRGVSPGSRAKVLVRPERICIGDEGGKAANALRGVIDTISFVGGMTRVTVREDRAGTVLLKCVSTRSHLRVQPGQPVDLHWSDADSIVLPA
jgi:putative spermidine/putrescine transport system ATP-binding protein